MGLKYSNFSIRGTDEDETASRVPVVIAAAGLSAIAWLVLAFIW